MAYLADNLGFLIYHAVGPGLGKRPRVADKTGLPGRYDFTLEFACGDCVVASPRDGSPIPANGAPAGSDGPTIFEAVERQLGLKLVRSREIPLEVLVIDRADRLPAAN